MKIIKQHLILMLITAVSVCVSRPVATRVTDRTTRRLKVGILHYFASQEDAVAFATWQEHYRMNKTMCDCYPNIHKLYEYVNFY